MAGRTNLGPPHDAVRAGGRVDERCRLGPDHPSAGGIIALDLLLGWTVLGWIGALAWALSDTRRQLPPAVIYAPPAPPQLSPDGRYWWDGQRWVAANYLHASDEDRFQAMMRMLE